MDESSATPGPPPAVASAEEPEIHVAPYCAEWPEYFDYEAPRILAAFGERLAGIEHFGSTSVPGLSAKPVVDILAGSSDASPPTQAEVERLEILGYVFLGEDGRRAGRRFWRKRGTNNFNLSLVPFMGVLWRDNVLVRDYLRLHPDEVELYTSVKRLAAQASPDSLMGYQEQKRGYMEELKMRARQWQQERNG